MKLFWVPLLAAVPLAAATTPVTFGTADVIDSVNGIDESISPTPAGDQIQIGPLVLGTGPNFGFLESITISQAGLYTLSADLILTGNAEQYNPSGRSGGASADIQAQFSIGPDAVSLDNPVSWTPTDSSVGFFGGTVTGSDTEFFSPGSYMLFGFIQGSSYAGGEGYLGVTSGVSFVDPPSPAPEPNLLLVIGPILMLIGTWMLIREKKS